MTKIMFPKLTQAIFIKKVNRFVAQVKINNEIENVHIPSTGRLDGVLEMGNRCYLKHSSNPNRKTKYTLFIVEANGVKVCIDSLIANKFVNQLLMDNKVNGINTKQIRNEVTIGKDRLDFVVSDRKGIQHFIEVKSVNKSDNGVACFPDAPTERGRKHVRSLIQHQSEEQIQSYIIFVIQRNDAAYFTSCKDRDQEFANLLEKAKENGVRILVCLTEVTEEGLYFDRWIDYRS